MVTTHRPILWPPMLALSGSFFVLWALFIGSYTPELSALQAKYANADEAFGVGAAFGAAKNCAASQEPLEIALQLAKDDAMRLQVSERLMLTYQKLAIVPKFVERAEFILEKADSDPKRSLTLLAEAKSKSRA